MRLFELFRGYGSQALALKKYGVEFENVGGCEIDRYADIAHEAIHGYVKNFGDITKVVAEELPDHDLCTYSFPCQDISNAGKQRGLTKESGTRSSLLWECERIIEAKKPKFLMMENVKALVGKKNIADFESWLSVLSELGYNNYWKVINAKNCGIPQNRERVFCVSIRKDIDDGTFKFEDDFDSGIRLKDVLESEVDEKYYLSDTAIKYMTRHRGGKSRWNSHINDLSTNACTLTANMYKGVPYGVITTKEQRQELSNNLNMIGMLDIKGNESIRRVYDPTGLCPTITTMGGGNTQPKVIETNKIIKVGSINSSQDGVIISSDGVAKTHTSGHNNCPKIIDKFRIRKLTPKECFRLMGVSEEDINKIQASGLSNSQQYKLAGNSIVVDCMKFLKNLPTR